MPFLHNKHLEVNACIHAICTGNLHKAALGTVTSSSCVCCARKLTLPVPVDPGEAASDRVTKGGQPVFCMCASTRVPHALTHVYGNTAGYSSKGLEEISIPNLLESESAYDSPNLGFVYVGVFDLLSGTYCPVGMFVLLSSSS